MNEFKKFLIISAVAIALPLAGCAASNPPADQAVAKPGVERPAPRPGAPLPGGQHLKNHPFDEVAYHNHLEQQLEQFSTPQKKRDFLNDKLNQLQQHKAQLDKRTQQALANHPERSAQIKQRQVEQLNVFNKMQQQLNKELSRLS
ncbi:hypothetical protein [Dongshaea marina]|uniref:hypothetical protein n=1 Tax=Dongshaea marina TaxID=2047966 RepID=UPI000D3E7148|nr:hypothetical protein [Dongshaea marina]